jgi:hypothetical protein
MSVRWSNALMLLDILQGQGRNGFHHDGRNCRSAADFAGSFTRR